MNKNILVVLTMIFLLSACSSKPKEVEQIDETTVDKTQWGYEMAYSSLPNPLSSMTNSVDTEAYLYLHKSFINGDTLLGRLNKSNDTFELVNKDKSKRCSVDNPQSCSGYIDVYGLRNINYYNGKLYLSIDTRDTESEKSIFEIYEMNIDGTNRNKVFAMDQFNQGNGLVTFVQFHKGYMYIANKNIIFKVNMENWNYQRLFEQESITYASMEFEDDTMFVNAHNYYTKEGTLYPNVVLKIDSNTGKEEILYPYKEDVLFISQKDGFLFEMKDDKTYYVRLDDKSEKKISDGWGYVFQKGDLLLYSDAAYDMDAPKFILLDKKGNILDTYDKKENYGIGELLTEHAFYFPVYEKDQDGAIQSFSLMKLDIVHHKFQKPIEIPIFT